MLRSPILATLTLAVPSLAQRVVEAPEPNASTLTATTLSCGEEAAGGLGTLSDEDWYRVVLAASTDLHVATGPGLGGAVRDTVVTLLDDTGGPLQQSDDGVESGWYSELFAAALPAGVYYVAVTAGANAVPGSYVLDVRCGAAAGATVPPTTNEAAENNDPRSGGVATSAIVPMRGLGALGSTGVDGDWDFWRVLVFGDSVLRVRLDATGAVAGTPAQDPVLYLFDGASVPNLVAGPFYASDRDAWDQVLDLRVAGGIHHLAVRGADGSQAGAYVLDVTATPAAAGTVFAGGCGGRTLWLGTTGFGPGAPLVRERPRLGSSYSVDGSSLGGNGFAFHVVGLQATFVDLTPFGAAGCALEVSVVDTVFQFADAVGNASWTIPVPDTAALIGTQLHSQIAVLDLSNALGITISNRVAATIGG
ncbi:MAG: PPC domain-containing protein [Planctomycetota bacterium]